MVKKYTIGLQLKLRNPINTVNRKTRAVELSNWTTPACFSMMNIMRGTTEMMKTPEIAITARNVWRLSPAALLTIQRR